MTHDPLCPPGWWMPGDDEPCAFCDLIARVREDERAAALRDAVERLPHNEECFSNDPDADERDCNCNRNYYVAAIRGLGGER